MKLWKYLIGNLLIFSKHYKYIIYSFLLIILYPQHVLSADCSPFRSWVRGGVSIDTYYNFHIQSAQIKAVNSVAFCASLQEARDIIDEKKPDYTARIKALEKCQNNIFERIKCYDGMEELNFKDYNHALKYYLDLIKETADLYLKMGEYYGASGEKQIAKKTYRYVITTYTEDIFKSYVKKAEFALKDLEEEQEYLAAGQVKQMQPEAKKKKAKKVSTLTMSKRPITAISNETSRDGRFIAYDDGTVTDTRTMLMWAAKDNGENINWADAKSYCENYRMGGYTDWRMPTQEELEGLYDATKTYKSDYCGYNVHLTEVIRLSCPWTWASGTSGSSAAFFRFSTGERDGRIQTSTYDLRALPVRFGK